MEISYCHVGLDYLAQLLSRKKNIPKSFSAYHSISQSAELHLLLGVAEGLSED